MAEVLTVLLAETGAVPSDGALHAAGRDVLRRAGGEPAGLRVEAVPGGRRELHRSLWVFHLASEAATAALRLIEAQRSLAGSTESASVRCALATGEAHVEGDACDGPAVAMVERALALAGPGRIVVSALTAAMVSHSLPPGAELVDLGTGDPRRGLRQPDRVHELRPASPSAETGGGTMPHSRVPSDLGWARRAAHGEVVGRAPQLATLEDRWAEVKRGDRRLAVLMGEAGIGKTTVAAELALRVEATGAPVLYGRWDEEALAPYQAIREALGTYAAMCPKRLLRADLAGVVDEVARLLPDVAARVGGARPPLVGDPGAERLRLFEAIDTWISRIASRVPVLLILDDLHWADPSSLLLLEHLSHTPGRVPLLMVATLRSSAVDSSGPLGDLAALVRDAEVTEIRLDGLPAAAIAHLVEQAVGRPLTPDEEAYPMWLADETAGNPLFVNEVLRSLRAAPERAAALRATQEALPEELSELVSWRLGRLDPSLADLLTVASVVGQEFAPGVLATVVGMTEFDLRARLTPAVSAGLVRPSTEPAGRFAFGHAVVRRVLRDRIEADQVVRLHGRIADILQPLVGVGATAAEVAHHRLRAVTAETVDAAVRWSRQAAEQARRQTAFETAVNFLRRAVEAHERFRGDAEVACELRLELADAHDRAGEFSARDAQHAEAATMARRLDRPDLFVRAALGYGGRLPANPPPNPTAQALLTEALDRLPEDDSRARALVVARLAHVRHNDAPYHQRRALADEAVAIARRLDAPVVLASVLMSRCLALNGPDDTDEELEIATEVRRIGERTGDPDLVLQAARARIHPLFVIGAHDAANELADSLSELAGQIRHPDHLRLAAMWRTMWAGLQGRFAEADEQIAALRTRLERAGHPQAAVIPFGQALPLDWLRGDLKRYRPLLEDAPTGPPTSLSGRSLAAWVAAGSGEPEQAAELLGELDPGTLAAADRNYVWLPTTVAFAIAASVGETRWAEVIDDLLHPYAGRNCVSGYAAFFGAVDHHRGAVALVLGRPDLAVDRLDSGLERHRELGARPWVALSARWLGDALVARAGPEDPDRAAALYAESSALAERLGLGGLPEPGHAVALRG